jgi:hypothetical protein
VCNKRCAKLMLLHTAFEPPLYLIRGLCQCVRLSSPTILAPHCYRVRSVYLLFREQASLSVAYCFTSIFDVCVFKRFCNMSDLFDEYVKVAHIRISFVRSFGGYCLSYKTSVMVSVSRYFSFLEIGCTSIRLIKYVMAEILYSTGWKELVVEDFLFIHHVVCLATGPSATSSKASSQLSAI